MDYKKSYHLLQAGVLGGVVAVFIGFRDQATEIVNAESIFV